jgi:hypothetical protein
MEGEVITKLLGGLREIAEKEEKSQVGMCQGWTSRAPVCTFVERT